MTLKTGSGGELTEVVTSASPVGATGAMVLMVTGSTSEAGVLTLPAASIWSAS